MLVGAASLPSSLISALQNIDILHHKKAKLPKHLQHSVCMCIERNLTNFIAYFRNTPNRYFRGRHCTNCNRDGHNDKSCPDPRRGKFCIMCCEKGHLYFKCPKKHCLRCGAESESYRLVHILSN